MNPSYLTPAMGVRERKKAYTRRMLVDAAVGLCLRQGYEATTIEQIVDAVEVSPRTFSRYFASKDAVFIAVLDELAEEVTKELDAQPPGVGPMEALRAAHVSVLTRVAEARPSSGLTAGRLVRILRVIYSSEALRHAATDYRSPPAMRALARRMDVPIDDPRLELAVALFATTIISACRDVIIGEFDSLEGPAAITRRLQATLGEVARFAAELQLP